MVLGSSMKSACENAVPENWQREANRVGATRERLFLSIIDDRNTIRHEVENHGVTEVKKSQSRPSLAIVTGRTHYKLWGSTEKLCQRGRSWFSKKLPNTVTSLKVDFMVSWT
jgi:hypothetical protein